jgi:uncharacterized NAD(P)/FAD-binding protein YdhS
VSLLGKSSSQAPTFQIKRSKACYLIIDGTYFKGDWCMVLYYDSQIRYSQMYRFTDKERYVQIKEDLENIQRLGIAIKAVTCDGHKAILKAVKQACSNAIIQRCLVHIHRESNIWLRQKPVNQQSIELKKIVNLIFKIKSNNDKLTWIKMFNDWYSSNEDHINEKKMNIETGRWWYVHRNLRRTAVMIRKAIPNMFHYMNDPLIPKSTNSVESFFGHLKDTLSIHRGMTYRHRKAFIQWYLHFKNQNRS